MWFSPLCPEVPVADGRVAVALDFLGPLRDGWGEDTRLGGVMDGLCCSFEGAGGVGMEAVVWPLSWALGSGQGR
jgi:hypothetical protein